MKTTVKVVAVLVLLVGTCLTARALYLHAKAGLASFLIRRAWNESRQTGKPRAPWPWADTQPIARLQIPRLRYDEIVLEGATPRTLAFGPAHMPSGAAVGEPGNLLVAGHRTSWFRPLEAIRQGDKIELEWFDAHRELHKRVYAVNMVRVVDPQDHTFLMPTAEDVLTLITCYPFGRGRHSPKRYVVRATPLDPASARAGGTEASVEISPVGY